MLTVSLESATSTLLERFDVLQKEMQDLKASLRKDEAITSPVTVDTRPRSPSAEASRDFLQIPPHRASADTVLQWTVFEGKHPPNALIGALFSPDHRDVADSGDLITTGISPIDEESIPALIDRFLQNVHTKNPILDVEALVKHGRRCADSGVGWDGSSCLVLMACALGAVAKPFSAGPVTEATSARLYAKELKTGDSCFTMACRRLGSLKYSMLAAQCHFFAGGTCPALPYFAND